MTKNDAGGGLVVLVSIAAYCGGWGSSVQFLYENEGLKMCGAGDGTRTRDVKLGKLAFYH